MAIIYAVMENGLSTYEFSTNPAGWPTTPVGILGSPARNPEPLYSSSMDTEWHELEVKLKDSGKLDLTHTLYGYDFDQIKEKISDLRTNLIGGYGKLYVPDAPGGYYNVSLDNVSLDGADWNRKCIVKISFTILDSINEEDSELEINSVAFPKLFTNVERFIEVSEGAISAIGMRITLNISNVNHSSTLKTVFDNINTEVFDTKYVTVDGFGYTAEEFYIRKYSITSEISAFSLVLSIDMIESQFVSGSLVAPARLVSSLGTIEFDELVDISIEHGSKTTQSKGSWDAYGVCHYVGSNKAKTINFTGKIDLKSALDRPLDTYNDQIVAKLEEYGNSFYIGSNLVASGAILDYRSSVDMEDRQSFLTMRGILHVG